VKERGESTEKLFEHSSCEWMAKGFEQQIVNDTNL